jgi:TOMM system kinase/cyclase fusion protein
MPRGAAPMPHLAESARKVLPLERDRLLVHVPGYRVGELLGEGGFARVFRAEQAQTGKQVALKLLRELDLGAQERERHRRRFWRETALCASLHHPHLVSLIDRGQTTLGALFAAYELVPGETLRDVLRRRGALPAPEAGALMAQVLDALACAHANGVLHRDLKPENIMLGNTGARPHAVVLDFGVGTFTERAQHAELTRIGESLGTPGYAAPEQLRGEASTSKSDIYSWGLVLLECLTGVRAVRGDSLAQILGQQLAATEIPLPLALAQGRLGALLRRVLRKSPAGRPADAAALYTELGQINLHTLVGEVVPADAPNALATTPDARDPHTDRLLRGECRQLTVLCASVEVHGNAAAFREQERLEQGQRSLLAHCRDTVEHFGGWVAGELAGRLLVYFGYPAAHDGDARRAVHAASRALQGWSQHPPELREGLEYRCTVHTGTVIVAEHGPTQGMTESWVLRLAALTPPSSLCVSSVTARLLESDSSIELCAVPTPCGAPDAVSLFSVTSCAQAPRGGLERRPALVGRERELESLLRRARDAAVGAGAVVLVRGEAGVGKSSLLRELGQRLLGDGPPAVCRCSFEQQNTALFPLLKLLEQTLGVTRVSKDSAASLLEARLAELGFDTATAAPILCAWLGLPAPERWPAPKESAERQKAVLFSILSRTLVEPGPAGSRLLLVDDLQWADPTTREFLAGIVAGSQPRGGLVVLAARLELTPWDDSRLIHFTLEGLPNARVAEMATDILGRPLNAPTLAAVSEWTAGVPLFVQELLRMLSDERLLAEADGRWELVLPLSAARVPVTLRALLTERLDRLGPARDTALLAAALGREFETDLLAAVSAKPRAELDDDLASLLARGVLMVQPAEGQLGFRHALIREALHGALLAVNRERIHGRIAETLCERFPERASTEPALVARHFAEARRFALAVEHGQRAASAALARAANQEAQAHAETVLEWATALPDTERVEAELRANGVLIQSLMGRRGWADAQVKRCIDRSTTLLAQAPSLELEASVRCALMTHHYVASHRVELDVLAGQFRAMADGAGDVGLKVVAHMFSGLVEHGAGRYERAAWELSASRDLYDRASHREHGRRFGLDSWVWATATLALVRWFQGEAQLAYALAADAVAYARQLEHLPSLGIALLYAGNLHHYAGDKARVVACSVELGELDQRYGFPAYGAYGAMLGAWAAGDSELPTSIAAQLEAMGCTAALSYYSSLAAETDAEQGRTDSGLARVGRCLELCRENDERYYQPALHRLRATLLLAKGDRGQARAELELAVDLAQAQGMPWLATQGARALADLVSA